MSLAGFNRTRARLAAEHKARVEAQKVIEKPKDKIIKVTADTNIEEAVKELTRPSDEPMEGINAKIGKVNELIIEEGIKAPEINIPIKTEQKKKTKKSKKVKK